jgi:hypothetical protein
MGDEWLKGRAFQIMRQRVDFAREGLAWSRERLFLQAFSDEVWAHGGAFTQSYVTVLIEGDPEAICKDQYLLKYV